MDTKGKISVDMQWRVTKDDVKRVRKLVDEQKNDRLVRSRKKTSMAECRLPASKKVFWQCMVHALLTTQNRSGRGTPIHDLVHECPFPLAYKTVRSKRAAAKFIAEMLKKRGGIRFYNRSGSHLARNVHILEQGEWRNATKKCNQLSGPDRPSKDLERKVASYIQRTFVGFGPKQSRNLLQMLGLTCYEIPIDSRLFKWLNSETSFPVELTPKFLAKKERYELVLDEVQKLCRKAKVYPCIFDAAVFVSQGENAQHQRLEQC